jgi:nicotinate-nucleotide pyrophosphorylase (carboxylating)
MKMRQWFIKSFSDRAPMTSAQKNLSLISIQDIQHAVQQTLTEDIGGGDLTASLIDAERMVNATLISRQGAVVCGTAWFDEVFQQLDSKVIVDWQVGDGDSVVENQELCRLQGPATSILTGERTALNWLQTLSGTATLTRSYVDRIAGISAVILDTRKTIPGLRLAQKYAVRCGGGHNHRVGLYDGILIKENHLRSSDSINSVLAQAQQQAPAGIIVEIEVDTLEQLKQVLDAGAKRVLLDNFTTEELLEAVSINKRRAKLEASGNINLENVREVAATGVDYISIGALTKHVRAIDLSLEFAQG